jgi:hypothetical protein
MVSWAREAHTRADARLNRFVVDYPVHCPRRRFLIQ